MFVMKSVRFADSVLKKKCQLSIYDIFPFLFCFLKKKRIFVARNTAIIFHYAYCTFLISGRFCQLTKRH